MNSQLGCQADVCKGCDLVQCEYPQWVVPAKPEKMVRNAAKLRMAVYIGGLNENTHLKSVMDKKPCWQIRSMR